VDNIRKIHLRVQEKLEKSQQLYKSRNDQHREDHKFCVGDKVWLYLSKERLQGAMKKLKPLRYGPFEIIEQVNENAFKLKLPPYMQINSVVNMEYLKLFEPSMLDEEEENQVLPTCGRIFTSWY
jgi:hypothetical protein